MKLQIKNARVIGAHAAPGAAGSPHGTDTTDLFVAAGVIAAIGTAPPGFSAERVFDARGLIVMPGLIDLAARLHEPGCAPQATLAAELAAAVAGGVTRLVCPPDTDADAMLDAPGPVQRLALLSSALNLAQVHPLGALTVGLEGTHLSEMTELHAAGCIAFSQARVPVLDTRVLLNALRYAATFGYTVWLGAQDPHLSRGAVAASGPVASRLGLAGVPAGAETIALYTILELVRMTGARVHVQHLSSAGAVALMRDAKREGLPVSCDVTIHHLHLIDADIGYFDTQYRLEPPLRTQRDRDALRAGLLDDTIDAICSDHTPLGADKKRLPFAQAAPGATGLELLLSLTVKWAQEARLPLAQALAKIHTGPATVLGLNGVAGRPAVARVAVGAVADLCVFDPDAYWRIGPATLHSRGHNSPFLGYELPAQVHATLVAGCLRFERAQRDEARFS